MSYSNTFHNSDLFSWHKESTFSSFIFLVSVTNGSYVNAFNYGADFDVLLDGATGARVSSVGILNNIQFKYLDYVFIIIGPGGVYMPDYFVTGNLQLALSVTMWEGDITQLTSLMGVYAESTFCSHIFHSLRLNIYINILNLYLHLKI